MAIDINRRAAFTRAFAMYPQILETFVEKHAELENILTQTPPRAYSSLNEKNSMMEILMAQFFVRLIQTRCINSTLEMEKFANSCVIRYHEYMTRKLGACQIVAEDKYRRALNQYEQNMSEIIISALVKEMEIIQEATAQGSDNDNKLKDWNEVDFWTDVFLSFGDNSRPRWPRWTLVAQEMFLEFKEQFAKALESEIEHAESTKKNATLEIGNKAGESA